MLKIENNLFFIEILIKIDLKTPKSSGARCPHLDFNPLLREKTRNNHELQI